jgi:hypothetical protein
MKVSCPIPGPVSLHLVAIEEKNLWVSDTMYVRLQRVKFIFIPGVEP